MTVEQFLPVPMTWYFFERGRAFGASFLMVVLGGFRLVLGSGIAFDIMVGDDSLQVPKWRPWQDLHHSVC